MAVMKNCKWNLAAIILLGIASPAVAETWTVDDDGPADFNDIQSAIEAAASGDEILVEPGIYTSKQDGHVVDTLGKPITLRSTQGAGSTIIDGQNKRRGIACFRGEVADTVIDGFTITNGYSADYDYDQNGSIGIYENDGGGMLCSYSSPTIRSCIFDRNMAHGTNAGGGLWISYGGILKIKDCVFSNNIAGNGGGIGCNSTNLTLDNCTLELNSARDENEGGESAGSAGGIWILFSTASLSNCAINDNTAALGGGGIWCDFYTDLTATDCTIARNIAGNHGGGLWIFTSTSALYNCSISGNQSPWDGGVDCWDSNTLFVDCMITGNSSTNSISDGGGGISFHYATYASMIGCTISKNTANQDGGGVLCEASDLQITSSIISGNSAKNIGGGIQVFADSNLTISYSSICGNNSDQINGTWIDGGNNNITDKCEINCPDINLDGTVDVYEVLSVIAAWNTDDPNADVNGDGIVETDDILLVLSAWGHCL